ncbi:MAG: hypothetical protein AB1397_07250 [bacterium]
MEVFRAIIDLVDKIVWPITILIMVGMFKYNIGRFINSLVDIFEKRGGEI